MLYFLASAVAIPSTAGTYSSKYSPAGCFKTAPTFYQVGVTVLTVAAPIVPLAVVVGFINLPTLEILEKSFELLRALCTLGACSPLNKVAFAAPLTKDVV